ncbi:lysophospholipase II [Apostasia shenzhenica]|uniref:Lysophospholipase II n=1 Tax=Apostasia shenzhenica TaxID=1088818 RepID=A0A2I0B707_9ASPA|nr:lysophospholipase II [Apostasia shenzhenica]
MMFANYMQPYLVYAGALTLASVLLYPRTLGGGAVFSGWVPFNTTIKGKVSPEARKTPILWSHGIADKTVLFEAGQEGPPFLKEIGMKCQFKVRLPSFFQLLFCFRQPVHSS